MEYSESVMIALGFAGEIPIGRGDLRAGRWHVQIFNKADDLRALSRVDVRRLLAVHGADRVEMIYLVQALWPAGIEPPWRVYLPHRPALITGAGRGSNLSIAAFVQKKSATPTIWQKPWRAAF